MSWRVEDATGEAADAYSSFREAAGIGKTIRRASAFGILQNDDNAAALTQAVLDEFSEEGGIVLIFDPAEGDSAYRGGSTVTLKKGCILMPPVVPQWNLKGQSPLGAVAWTMVNGANCDAFNVAVDAYGARLEGFVGRGNQNNQSAGCGVRFLGEVVADGSGNEKRTKAVLRWCDFGYFHEDGFRFGFRPSDGNNIQRVYSVNLEYVTSRYNGGYGYRGVTGDLSLDKIFGWHNAEAGWFEEAGSGATRARNCDFWDNDTYGQILEGQNGEWIGLQTDLNRIGGTRIRKNPTGSVPARHSFIAGNTNQNAEDGNGGADFHISDAAYGLIWAGFKFGYITSGEGKPRYAIYDDSVSPAPNIAQGTFTSDNGQYTVGFGNEAVMDNYQINVAGVAQFVNGFSSRATNLVLNGSFKRWTSANVPDGFAKTGTFTAAFADVGRGKGALLTAGTTDETEALDQTLDFDYTARPGERALALLDVKASGTTTKKLQIREGTNVTEVAIPNDGLWRQVVLTRTLGSPVSGALTVRIQVKTSGDGVTSAGADTMSIKGLAFLFGRNPTSIAANPKDGSLGYQALENSATPNVRISENWLASDATSVTGFSGPAYEGRDVYVIGNGSKQFTHGTLRNKGGVNVTPASGEVIHYRYLNGAWRQL